MKSLSPAILLVTTLTLPTTGYSISPIARVTTTARRFNERNNP